MKLKRLLAMLLLLTLLLQGWSATAWAVTAKQVKDLAGEFSCNCGCGKNLAVCEDKGCGPVKRAFIKEQLVAGKTREQVITIMKARYGTEILAAPEKTGFGLVAWIVPFAVFFAGVVGVIKVMSGWVAYRREHGNDGDGPKDDTPKDHRYDDRIDKELKDFGW